MRYRDIIEEMKHQGHYSEAERYERILEQNGHHEWDYAPRYDAADGAAHSRIGDLAERAAYSLRRDEERREEQAQEEERMAQEARHRREQMERELEDEYWAAQQQPPYPEQPEPECQPTHESGP